MINTPLFSALQQAVRIPGEWTFSERVSASVRPLVALALMVVIYQVVKRNPWPRPFRLRFVALHVIVSALITASWIGISRLIEAIFLGWGPTVPYEEEFVFIGTVAYLIVAGIAYSVESTARAARAEAAAASTQLAALRAQLHPHFLFNALHTVVQLIPSNPTLAMEAAEIVADLLRRSVDEQRDQVPLADEWRFVSRYLAMERIRFGDRLKVRDALPHEVMSAQVPTFALQTLVENAVRHGASPRIAATDLVITASGTAASLTLTVRNDADADALKVISAGTGLARLRERLTVLHGNAATLTAGPVDGGYVATLVVPQNRAQ